MWLIWPIVAVLAVIPPKSLDCFSFNANPAPSRAKKLQVFAMNSPQTPPEDLSDRLDTLAGQVKILNAQAFFQRQNAPARLLGMQFLKGVAFGLGSVLGATVVVSLLVYSLSQINFIPIIGDWAAQIAERIQR